MKWELIKNAGLVIFDYPCKPMSKMVQTIYFLANTDNPIVAALHQGLSYKMMKSLCSQKESKLEKLLYSWYHCWCLGDNGMGLSKFHFPLQITVIFVFDNYLQPFNALDLTWCWMPCGYCCLIELQVKIIHTIDYPTKGVVKTRLKCTTSARISKYAKLFLKLTIALNYCFGIKLCFD